MAEDFTTSLQRGATSVCVSDTVVPGFDDLNTKHMKCRVCGRMTRLCLATCFVITWAGVACPAMAVVRLNLACASCCCNMQAAGGSNINITYTPTINVCLKAVLGDGSSECAATQLIDAGLLCFWTWDSCTQVQCLPHHCQTSWCALLLSVDASPAVRCCCP